MIRGARRAASSIEAMVISALAPGLAHSAALALNLRSPNCAYPAATAALRLASIWLTASTTASKVSMVEAWRAL